MVIMRYVKKQEENPLQNRLLKIVEKNELKIGKVNVGGKPSQLIEKILKPNLESIGFRHQVSDVFKKRCKLKIDFYNPSYGGIGVEVERGEIKRIAEDILKFGEARPRIRHWVFIVPEVRHGSKKNTQFLKSAYKKVDNYHHQLWAKSVLLIAFQDVGE